MLPAALAVIAAIALARSAYPRYFERRALKRLPLGPDGIVMGAGTIDLPRDKAHGALLLHGAGDTPQVLAGLATSLYARGYSVRAPLLSGHGRSLSSFAAVSSSQWHDDVRREYASMLATHDSVAIVGLSMGGALAVRFAADEKSVPALVLLAPYVTMPALVRRVAARSALWRSAFPYFSSGGSQSIHDPDAAARGLGHGVFTPTALHALYDVVVAAEKALPGVTAPTMMIQSREDNRISIESARRTFERLGASEKRLIWTEGAGHVITVDFGHEEVFELTGKWLDHHLRAAGGGLPESNEGSVR